MNRKHILRDSLIIFVFFGSLTALIFVYLLGAEFTLELEPLSEGDVVATAILYVLAIVFGSTLSIPAAVINYVLTKYSFKKNYHAYFFKTKLLTCIYSVVNGIVITALLTVFIMIRDSNANIAQEVVVFIGIPCISSSVLFCFYSRNNT